MRATHPEFPVSVSMLPFLFMRGRDEDEGCRLRAALAAAAAAERADDARRNSRGRLAYLLCELGYQIGRRGGSREQVLALPREELAEALGTSLCKVKRTLALLALTGVIEADGRRVRIVDWPRLAALARFDRRRLALEEEEAALPADEPASAETRAGDPACFV